ncbi:hypothetical protein HPP92_016300 [Vanilla planifolia]|uniref:Uncharacterized protein n=1 Tax=Vanilla planifolia TaxID=51239 RepID=A0A835UR48_VANPL|nr:hypothetical protein HPP92_016300 [Vanilla planifolia]
MGKAGVRHLWVMTTLRGGEVRVETREILQRSRNHIKSLKSLKAINRCICREKQLKMDEIQGMTYMLLVVKRKCPCPMYNIRFLKHKSFNGGFFPGRYIKEWYKGEPGCNCSRLWVLESPTRRETGSDGTVNETSFSSSYINE